MDSTPFIVGNSILLVAMLYACHLVKVQLQLLRMVIRNAMDVADANIEMGYKLAEYHQAWSKAQDIHQCSTCRANSLLRGAKFSG